MSYTPEERRAYNAARRAKMTPEEREAERKYQRDYKRNQRHSGMTPEEKEADNKKRRVRLRQKKVAQGKTVHKHCGRPYAFNALKPAKPQAIPVLDLSVFPVHHATAHGNPCARTVHMCLVADDFDAAIVAHLAKRDRLPDAARLLHLECKGPEPRCDVLGTLRIAGCSPHLLPRRMSGEFQLTSGFGTRSENRRIDANLIRSWLAHRNRNVVARTRLVLSALGELSDWGTATRRERAAFVLHHLAMVTQR